jgi:hypothetical protein
MVVFSLVVLKEKLKLYRIQTDGELIPMTILFLPKDCTIRGSTIQLQFGNKRFHKKASPSICYRHKVGDNIPMKYIQGGESVLYPDESINGDLVALGVFIVVGMFSFILGFRKKGT